MAQVPDVRPLYYSMLLFTEATRNASLIYEAKFTTSNNAVKAWVVRVSIWSLAQLGGWR